MRQFILSGQEIRNGLVSIDGNDYRYLRQVLRVRPGDMISVRLEDGSLANATVAKVDDKKRCVLLQFCAAGENSFGADEGSITRGVQASALNSGFAFGIEFWLFQFITKPQKFEQIVRQATECGISKIIPVKGEYSEKSSVLAFEGNKRDRLERIIREARQQSGSPVSTEILPPLGLEDALSLWQKNDCQDDGGLSSLGIVLYERTDKTENLSALVNRKKNGLKKAAVCVGCEGGISPAEIEFLSEKGLFHRVHFAVNILRAETAALYGIAALQSAILSE